MFRKSARCFRQALKTYNPGHNQKTFMVFQVGGVAEPLRLEFEIYGKTLPMAAENFGKLCSGEGVLPYQAPMETIADPTFKDQYEPQLSYKGTEIHRIMPNFIVQGGDVTGKQGEGNLSVFGPSFDAPGEIGAVKFDRPGLLGTAVTCPSANGSQFFILTTPKGKGAPHLDGTCICFGHVSKGLDKLTELSLTLDLTHEGTPVNGFRVIECGIL